MNRQMNGSCNSEAIAFRLGVNDYILSKPGRDLETSTYRSKGESIIHRGTRWAQGPLPPSVFSKFSDIQSWLMKQEYHTWNNFLPSSSQIPHLRKASGKIMSYPQTILEANLAAECWRLRYLCRKHMKHHLLLFLIQLQMVIWSMYLGSYC